MKNRGIIEKVAKIYISVPIIIIVILILVVGKNFIVKKYIENIKYDIKLDSSYEMELFDSNPWDRYIIYADYELINIEENSAYIISGTDKEGFLFDSYSCKKKNISDEKIKMLISDFEKALNEEKTETQQENTNTESNASNTLDMLDKLDMLKWMTYQGKTTGVYYDDFIYDE